MNFCVAILILKMEEKRNILRILFFIISRTVKTQRQKVKKKKKKRQKRFVKCMEKMMWLIKHVKRGLQSFMLEISCCTMHLGQEYQLNVITIKSRCSLRTANITPRRRELINSKYPNQLFTIISLVLLITLMFVNHISESCSVVSNFLWPHGLYSPWNSPGQNTRVGSLSHLQWVFSTQGSNPGLPHRRQILYQLCNNGSPYQII